jgi:hypothetical protein
MGTARPRRNDERLCSQLKPLCCVLRRNAEVSISRTPFALASQYGKLKQRRHLSLSPALLAIMMQRIVFIASSKNQ